MYKRIIFITAVLCVCLLTACGNVIPAEEGKKAVAVTMVLGAGDGSVKTDAPIFTEEVPTETAGDTETGVDTGAETDAPEVTVTPAVVTGTPEVTPTDAVEITVTPTMTPVADMTATPTPEQTTATPTPTNTPSPTPTNTPTPAQAKGSYSASDCKVSLGSVTVKPGDDFTSNVNAAGTLLDQQEGQACLDDGYDINYYYDGVTVCTLSKDGQQLIYDVDITKTGFKNAKGIIIGTSGEDDLVAAYGDSSESGGMRRAYKDGRFTLIFYVQGGIVTEIELVDNSVG